jgi:hypothetical protein
MALARCGWRLVSEIEEVGKEVRKKSEGEKTLVTEKFPKWEKQERK